MQVESVGQPTKLLAKAVTIECKMASRVNDQGDFDSLLLFIKEAFLVISICVRDLLTTDCGALAQQTSLPERPQGSPNFKSYNNI